MITYVYALFNDRSFYDERRFMALWNRAWPDVDPSYFEFSPRHCSRCHFLSRRKMIDFNLYKDEESCSCIFSLNLCNLVCGVTKEKYTFVDKTRLFYFSPVCPKSLFLISTLQNTILRNIFDCR